MITLPKELQKILDLIEDERAITPINYIKTIKISRKELKQPFVLVKIMKIDMQFIVWIYKFNEWWTLFRVNFQEAYLLTLIQNIRKDLQMQCRILSLFCVNSALKDHSWCVFLASKEEDNRLKILTICDSLFHCTKLKALWKQQKN